MGALRVILALAVVIGHSDAFLGLRLTGGLVAVEIFFIISGFYMALILDTKYTGPGSYRLFMSNRLLRLLPVYWAVAALTVTVALVAIFFDGGNGRLASYFEHGASIGAASLCYLVLTNVILFGQDLVMFLGLDSATGALYFTPDFKQTDPQLHSFLLVPQAWTLGIELMFYLIAPFIVRRRLSVLFALIALSLATRAAIYLAVGTHDPWTYRFFPCELALFLLGVVGYRLYVRLSKVNLIAPAVYCIVFGFFGVVLCYQFIPNIGPYVQLVNWTLYALAAVAIPLIFRLTSGWKWDSRIGELSYPIYVVHILIIESVTPLVTRSGLDMYLGEFAVVLSVLASLVLVKYVAEPVEDLRRARVKRIMNRTRTPLAAGALADAG